MQILEENRKAADTSHAGSADLDALSGAFMSPKGIKPQSRGGGSSHALSAQSPAVMMKRKKKGLKDEEDEESSKTRHFNKAVDNSGEGND